VVFSTERNGTERKGYKRHGAIVLMERRAEYITSSCDVINDSVFSSFLCFSLSVYIFSLFLAALI